jgi:site-specific recombinase XerC
VPTDTWHRALSAYHLYLEQEAGLTPATVQNYLEALRAPVAAFLLAENPALLVEPGKLTPEQVTRFVEWARRRGYQGSTINHHLTVWRGFLRWMGYDGNWGVYQNALELAEPVRYRAPEQAVWTLDEAMHFLDTVAAVSDRPALDHALFTVFLTTGLRLFEVLALRWEHVQWEAARLWVRGKGQKERFVPLIDRATVSLERYRGAESPTTGPVFVRQNGVPCGRDYVIGRFRRFSKQAGLDGKGLTVHQLRHTALTLLIQAGVDVYTVKEVAGHASLNTTGTYLHLHGPNLVARFRAASPF